MYITNHNQLQQQHQHQNDDNLMSTSSSSATTTTSSSEEFTTLENKNMSKKLISMCFGCGNQITDQFILRVAPDLEWHAKCLKCFECGQYLDENCTCFVRNGKTYCKLDYLRLFSKKCFRCKEGFKKNDFVMRANNRIYHVECFRCFMCNKQLAPGDEFAPKEDGLLCKLDNENFEKHSLQQQQQQNASSLINLQPVNVAAGASSLASSSASSSAPSSSSASPSLVNNNSNSTTTNNTSCQNITNLQQMSSSLLAKNCDDLSINTVDYEDNQNCLSPSLNHHQQQQQFHANMLNSPHSRHLQQQQQQQSANSNAASSSSTSSSSSNSSHLHSNHHAHASQSSSGQATTSGGGHHRKDKTTRVRTVLNEKQLHTLRTCYGANPRPDALMKEQLVEMTGLSPRVIRVWFQNKRCKDKKKTILIKQMQEQQKNRQSIGHGIPMIAGSPLRNDINNLGPGSQVEMQHTSNAYLHHHQSSHLAWKQMDGYGMNGQLMDPSGASAASGSGLSGTNSNGQLMPPYDQMMGFQSDEEDCFDQLSDQGGDDSVSSVGLDDTRIQQL